MKIVKLFILITITLLFFSGCKAREVSILKDRYISAIPSSAYGKYQGKPIVVTNVTNNAADTYFWSYKDQDKRLWYITDVSLEEYVQSSLTSAFRKVGMTVYASPKISVEYSRGPFGAQIPMRTLHNENYKAPRGVNDLRIFLLSMTSRVVIFKATLIRDEVILFDEALITAAIDKLPDDLDSDESFTKYAYSLIDAMVTAMLNNPSFSAQLLASK